MPRYEALVHVVWELPFPLRLPPTAFLCWEPGEGIALFDPRPEVGDLVWRRRSTFLQAAEVFPELGHPNECYPAHDYTLTTLFPSGREIKTALLKHGSNGGFVEARPYTVANIFLCLRQRADYASQSVVERAAASLNNIVEVYRFFTMDPLARSLRAERDCYYTLLSVGDLPPESGEIEPQSALQHVASVSFGSVIGVSRAHRIGLNSFDDLLAGETLPLDVLRLFNSLVSSRHELELFHQLMFSAIRRLKRSEHALAVLDAQSALESLVAVLIVEDLKRRGQTSQQIEAEMSPAGKHSTLQRRFEELDRIAVAQTPSGAQQRRFLGSPEEAQWRTSLYRLRNRIVHEGLREVSFADAKAGLVAGLHAIHRIQDLTPAFGRAMMWSGAALDLGHVQQSAGRISRLFEA